MIWLVDVDSHLSEIYHSLRATRRRYVIQILNEANEDTFTTKNLARKIASIEEKVPEQRATGEPYRNVYNALSQTHLPALSEAGIIIYDSNRQTATAGDELELVALLLKTDTATVDVLSKQTDNHDSDDDTNPQ